MSNRTLDKALTVRNTYSYLYQWRGTEEYVLSIRSSNRFDDDVDIKLGSTIEECYTSIQQLNDILSKKDDSISFFVGETFFCVRKMPPFGYYFVIKDKHQAGDSNIDGNDIKKLLKYFSEKLNQ